LSYFLELNVASSEYKILIKKTARRPIKEFPTRTRKKELQMTTMIKCNLGSSRSRSSQTADNLQSYFMTCNVMPLWCHQAVKLVNCRVFISVSTSTKIVKIAQATRKVTRVTDEDKVPCFYGLWYIVTGILDRITYQHLLTNLDRIKCSTRLQWDVVGHSLTHWRPPRCSMWPSGEMVCPPL